MIRGITGALGDAVSLLYELSWPDFKQRAINTQISRLDIHCTTTTCPDIPNEGCCNRKHAFHTFVWHLKESRNC